MFTFNSRFSRLGLTPSISLQRFPVVVLAPSRSATPHPTMASLQGRPGSDQCLPSPTQPFAGCNRHLVASINLSWFLMFRAVWFHLTNDPTRFS